MNSRQRQILIHLFDNETWIKGKELSKIMGVTDRTIRSDIESLNQKYKKIIESVDGKDIKLTNEHITRYYPLIVNLFPKLLKNVEFT